MAATDEVSLVSVLMPAYNASLYIREAIDSALAQQDASVELVVIDDGSTDDTRTIVEGYGTDVVFRRASRVGTDMARNRAIDLASGRYFAFLDADDIYPPRSVASRLEHLLAHPELEAVYGHAHVFYSPELADDLRNEVRIPKEVVGVEQANTMLITRAGFEKVGAFASWQVGGGIDWTLRSHEAGLRFDMLAEVVLERRIHRTNTGRLASARRSGRLHVLKAALDRRRAMEDEPESP